jgi:hypothetical protein
LCVKVGNRASSACFIAKIAEFFSKDAVAFSEQIAARSIRISPPTAILFEAVTYKISFDNSYLRKTKFNFLNFVYSLKALVVDDGDSNIIA